MDGGGRRRGGGGGLGRRRAARLRRAPAPAAFGPTSVLFCFASESSSCRSSVNVVVVVPGRGAGGEASEHLELVANIITNPQGDAGGADATLRDADGRSRLRPVHL